MFSQKAWPFKEYIYYEFLTCLSLSFLIFRNKMLFVSARCALKTPKLKRLHLKNYIRYRYQTSDFFFEWKRNIWYKNKENGDQSAWAIRWNDMEWPFKHSGIQIKNVALLFSRRCAKGRPLFFWRGVMRNLPTQTIFFSATNTQTIFFRQQFAKQFFFLQNAMLFLWGVLCYYISVTTYWIISMILFLRYLISLQLCQSSMLPSHFHF